MYQYAEQVLQHFVSYEKDAVPDSFPPPLQVRRGFPMGSGGIAKTPPTVVTTVTTLSTNPCSPNSVVENTNKELEVSVYPNPSNGIFSMQMNNEQLTNINYQLSIYNVMGEKVFQSQISNLKLQISLDAPSGIYFYKLSSLKEIISTGKFVIE